jgi:hypothetical protein
MLPITALPYATFVLALSAGGYAFAVAHCMEKAGFDQALAHGEIGIACWTQELRGLHYHAGLGSKHLVSSRAVPSTPVLLSLKRQQKRA